MQAQTVCSEFSGHAEKSAVASQMPLEAKDKQQQMALAQLADLAYGIRAVMLSSQRWQLPAYEPLSALATARAHAGDFKGAFEASVDAHGVAGGCLADVRMDVASAARAAQYAAAAGMPEERDHWLAQARSDFVRMVGKEGGHSKLFDEVVA